MCKCQGRALTYCMTSIQKGNIRRDRLEQLTGTLPKKKIIRTAFFFFLRSAWKWVFLPAPDRRLFPALLFRIFFIFFSSKGKKKQFVKLLFWYCWLLDKLWNTFIINLAGCREYQIHALNRCEITLLLNDKYIFQNPSNSCPGALIAQNLSSLDFVNPRHQSQLRSQRDLELLHTAVLEMTSTSCLQVSHGCKDPQVLRGKVLVRLAPLFFFSCHYCYTLWSFGVFLFWFTAFFFFFFQSWLYYHKSCNLNNAVCQENLTSFKQ